MENVHFSIDNPPNLVKITGIENLSPGRIYTHLDSRRIMIVGGKAPEPILYGEETKWLNVVMYHPDYPNIGYAVPTSAAWSKAEFVPTPDNTVIRLTNNVVS